MKLEWIRSKTCATLACSALMLPVLIGCGSGTDSSTVGANQAPVDDSRAQSYPTQQIPQQKKGMSTGTKVALLAGAAALYYMYKKNKAQHASGAANGQPQYYLSKNGRVYYRDSSGRAHWVTPPQQGIQVPASEAQQYQQFQGYNGRSDGMTLGDLHNEPVGPGGF